MAQGSGSGIGSGAAFPLAPDSCCGDGLGMGSGCSHGAGGGTVPVGDLVTGPAWAMALASVLAALSLVRGGRKAT